MRFSLILFLTGMLLTGLLYGLNVAVDPYNKLGNNPFGFKTKAVDFARENKFNQVVKFLAVMAVINVKLKKIISFSRQPLLLQLLEEWPIICAEEISKQTILNFLF
jgi:hypothetical protein